MAWKNACRERGIKDDQVKVAAARKARELIDQDRAEERRKHTDSTFNRLFGCSPELTSDHPSITQGEADTPLSPLFRGYKHIRDRGCRYHTSVTTGWAVAPILG